MQCILCFWTKQIALCLIQIDDWWFGYNPELHYTARTETLSAWLVSWPAVSRPVGCVDRSCVFDCLPAQHHPNRYTWVQARSKKDSFTCMPRARGIGCIPRDRIGRACMRSRMHPIIRYILTHTQWHIDLLRFHNLQIFFFERERQKSCLPIY